MLDGHDPSVFGLQALEEQVDVGSILVDRTQSCELVLLNNGACSLKYVLSVEQTITGPCDPEEVAGDRLGIYSRCRSL